MANYNDLSGNTPPAVIRDRAAQDGQVAQGIYDSVAPTLAAGQTYGLRLNAAGELVVATGPSSSEASTITVAGASAERSYMVNALGMGTGLPTYSAIISPYTAYATPTDMYCLIGSASKTIVPVFFGMFAVATAASLISVDWVKRSTLNTAGTPTNATNSSFDTNNAASTAVLRSYGAAPGALGTSQGILNTQTALISAATGNPTSVQMYGLIGGIISSDCYQTPVILRGATECLCCNFRGAALPAGFSATLLAQWIEF